MSKRYIVTITDTEGTIWLNTGSFEIASTKKFFIEKIQWIIELVSK